MTCNETDNFFDRDKRSADVPREIVQHLTECRRCERVYSLLNVDRVDLGPAPSPVQQRIVRELISDLQPVPPLPGDRRLGVAVFGAALAIVLVPTAMMGAKALPLMNIWQTIAIVGVLGGAAVMVAFSLACQHIPGSRHFIAPRPAVAGSLLLLFCVTPLVLPWRHHEAFIASGLRCFATGMMIAVPAVVVLWFVLRRGVVLSPRTTGASLGLMAGIAALTVLELNCRIIEAGHVAAWHLSVLLFMTLMGLFAGPSLWSRTGLANVSI